MTDLTAPPAAPAPGPGRATTTPTGTAVGVVVDGRYHIVKPLAAGGMGSVYLGEQGNLRRPVAIKLIRQPAPEDAERFRREAEALAAVSHPAIVEVYDYLAEAEVSYLVMAYVAGENIADYLASRPRGVLAPIEALELLLPVASALVELHARGILHRDLKPANLVRYLRADGQAAVKLVDFGIARRQEDPGLTAKGLIVGTPPYLSPEVILGKAHSEASDVYAFGAMLFELLCGDAPHGRDDLHLILKRAIHDEVRLPPELAGTPLGGLLLRLLARTDELRPRMQSVLEEMEQLRLSLLVGSGALEKALQATRTLSGPLEATCETDARRAAVGPAATRSLKSGPRWAEQAGDPIPTTALPSAPAPARGAAPAWPEGAAPPGTALAQPRTARVGVSADAALTQRPGRAPWIVAGASIALGVGTLLFFVLREPSRPPAEPRASGAARASRADDGAGGDLARPEATPPPDRGRPAREPAPRGLPDAETDAARRAVGGSPAPTDPEVAALLARCTDKPSAYQLFNEANLWFRAGKRSGQARKTFEALLFCRHTSTGQRRWVLARLTKIHASAGECAKAEQLWTQYLAVAQSLGIPPGPQPACPPRPR